MGGAEGVTIQLALHGGNDKGNSLGSSNSCGGGGGVRGGRGVAEGLTIQLALHGGDDKGNSLGSSSGCGHNVEGSCSGTAKVTVGSIQQPLVSCV